MRFPPCLSLAGLIVAHAHGEDRAIAAFKLVGSNGKSYAVTDLTRQPALVVFMSVRCCPG